MIDIWLFVFFNSSAYLFWFGFLWTLNFDNIYTFSLFQAKLSEALQTKEYVTDVKKNPAN